MMTVLHIVMFAGAIVFCFAWGFNTGRLYERTGPQTRKDK